MQYNNEVTGKKDFDSAVRKKFNDIKYLDNNSYAFADSFTKATDAVKLSKDDFDPKLLQRILDDLMNENTLMILIPKLGLTQIVRVW